MAQPSDQDKRDAHDDIRQVAGGAGLAFLGRLGALIEAVSVVVFTWAYGAETFGLFAVLWSYVKVTTALSDAAMTNAVRAEELTVVANELSTSTDGVSHQIARFNLGNPRSGRRATASAPAPTTAPAPAAPEMYAPVSTSATMNGNASAGLDVDERGFGSY